MTVWRGFFAHLLIHRRRHLNYGFPKKIGIDEHFFGMSSSTRFQPVAEQKFHTTLVDRKAHRLYRAVKNRDAATLFDQLKNEPGGAGVEEVAMDMSPGYRNLSRAPIGQSRIFVGEGGAYKFEHQVICISRTYKASWARETVDLALLEKLRWKDGLKLEEIATRLSIGASTVKRGVRKLRVSRAAVGKALPNGPSGSRLGM